MFPLHLLTLSHLRTSSVWTLSALLMSSWAMLMFVSPPVPGYAGGDYLPELPTTDPACTSPGEVAIRYAKQHWTGPEVHTPQLQRHTHTHTHCRRRDTHTHTLQMFLSLLFNSGCVNVFLALKNSQQVNTHLFEPLSSACWCLWCSRWTEDARVIGGGLLVSESSCRCQCWSVAAQVATSGVAEWKHWTPEIPGQDVEQ